MTLDRLKVETMRIIRETAARFRRPLHCQP